MSLPTPIPCPACLHSETMRARIGQYEVVHDDPILMHWCDPPGGAGAAVCSRWDRGAWLCDLCGIRLEPGEAGVLLDAVLQHAFPACDSLDADGVHADTRRAMNPHAEACDDGNPCTPGDASPAAAAQPPAACDDGNPCTDDDRDDGDLHTEGSTP